MDTVNHYFTIGNDFKKALTKSGIADKVVIPLDGETVNV